MFFFFYFSAGGNFSELSGLILILAIINYAVFFTLICILEHFKNKAVSIVAVYIFLFLSIILRIFPFYTQYGFTEIIFPILDFIF